MKPKLIFLFQIFIREKHVKKKEYFFVLTSQKLNTWTKFKETKIETYFLNELKKDKSCVIEGMNIHFLLEPKN